MVATRKVVIGFCIVWASVLSFVALLLPPRGEIDSSVLVLIAQVLLLVATCVGLNLPVIINGTKTVTKPSGAN